MYINSSDIGAFFGNESGPMESEGLGALDTAKAKQIFEDHWNKLSSSQRISILSQAIQGNTTPLTDQLVQVGVQFCKRGIGEAFKDYINKASQKMFKKNVFKN